MRWNWVAIVASAACVSSHATHHVEDQQAFSQDRLDELERKWGTDVSLKFSSVWFLADIA
jgi:agmatinase